MNSQRDYPFPKSNFLSDKSTRLRDHSRRGGGKNVRVRGISTLLYDSLLETSEKLPYEDSLT